MVQSVLELVGLVAFALLIQLSEDLLVKGLRFDGLKLVITDWFCELSGSLEE